MRIFTIAVSALSTFVMLFAAMLLGKDFSLLMVNILITLLALALGIYNIVLGYKKVGIGVVIGVGLHVILWGWLFYSLSQLV